MSRQFISDLPLNKIIIKFTVSITFVFHNLFIILFEHTNLAIILLQYNFYRNYVYGSHFYTIKLKLKMYITWSEVKYYVTHHVYIFRFMFK